MMAMGGTFVNLMAPAFGTGSYGLRDRKNRHSSQALAKFFLCILGLTEFFYVAESLWNQDSARCTLPRHGRQKQSPADRCFYVSMRNEYSIQLPFHNLFVRGREFLHGMDAIASLRDHQGQKPAMFSVWHSTTL
jgi:hypothetical protein